MDHITSYIDPVTLLITLAVVGFLTLVYHGKGFFAVVTAALLGMAAYYHAYDLHGLQELKYAWIALAVYILFFAKTPIRKFLLSKPLLGAVGKVMPKISETENTALKAGTVFWEADVFSGSPNWKKLHDFKIPELTAEEQAFIDGPTEELCKMLDDHDICQKRELPEDIMNFIKKEKFLGMLVSKDYGGLGFGANAQSAVVTKIASRSSTAAVVVMVPNSLGPAELLLHYGTQEQKDHYLPKLAVGEEVPCFALTEPTAGSDAANGRSRGVVCMGKHNGKEVLGIRISFKKRYITLAPIATVIGLAFKLYDPDKLLGDKEDIGITCALLPRSTKGLQVGRRHDPSGIPFPNGTVEGEDVFIPMDYVIGGKNGVGTGWRMLMESLSAGRGISLPSLSVGATQLAARATSAYAIVREQFGVNIGKFEGVAERMARIAGFAYGLEATKNFTCGAVDAGEKPSVASAIAKAYLTENMRTAMNDGMDILAGAAICRGPRNILNRGYASIPIGITVEGANILTRSLIVFGQGAIRCHPFVLDQVEAIAEKDVERFDAAFFGHINHVVKNKVRAFTLGLTGGRLSSVPSSATCFDAKYYRKLAHLSASFAYCADLALASLGGALKMKESLSGRYADAMSWMYIASSILKRFEDEGRKPEDRAAVDYMLTHALYEIEHALDGVIRNLPNRVFAASARVVCFPLGLRCHKPTDKQMTKLIKELLDDKSAFRDHITRQIYIPQEGELGLGLIEQARNAVIAAQGAFKKLNKLKRTKQVAKDIAEKMAQEAHEKGLLSQEDVDLIVKAEELRYDAVQVDSFTGAEFKRLK